MKVLKYSRQRESIISYLAKTKEHPTADTIYTNIRTVYPNVSLGTVYRNLNLLVQQGDILKLVCSDGTVRYDGNLMQHYHFLCTECSRVEDLRIPAEALEHINRFANADFDGEILGHHIFFYGICSHCKSKK